MGKWLVMICNKALGWLGEIGAGRAGDVKRVCTNKKPGTWFQAFFFIS